MHKIIKKFKILIMIYITIIIGATYFSIYLPVKKVLKENALDNFLLQVQSDKKTIENYMVLCNERSVILSSDYNMIDNIETYIAGETDKNTLESNLVNEYRSHATSIKNLLSATRYVDNEKVAVFNNLSPPEQIIEQSRLTLRGTVVSSNVGLFYRVYSPIINHNNLLGYDVCIYELDNIISTFNNNNYDVTLVEPDSAKDVLSNNIIYTKNSMSLYANDDKILFVGNIENTEAFIRYEVNNDALYMSLTTITVKILLGCILGVVVMAFFTNMLIVRSAAKLLALSEKSREKYKQCAIKDPLSDAYSRLFFENWLEKQALHKNSDEPFYYTLALIDIDHFKLINDSFGHLDGDKAIHSVASVLISTVRTSDYVIRYGGDEFMILFENCNEIQANEVMHRVIEKLKEIDVINFDISISYGLQEIKDRKDILEAINLADQKMYDDKKSKNIIFEY